MISYKFKEIEAVVGCPYCRVRLGKPCVGQYKNQPDNSPHRSRFRLAREILDRNRRLERKAGK